MMEDTIKEKIRDVINKDFLPNDDGGIEMIPGLSMMN